MHALVTGAAGFIGSHLVEALLEEGADVIAVDAFTPYYDPSAKRRNIMAAAARPRLKLVEGDLLSIDLRPLLSDVDTVYHLAAQPGVRLSWADGFSEYARSNIHGTQRLLEAARSSGIRRFVYASSSSVYGNAPEYPTAEDDLPRPHSPYGVTKLAAEHLCGLYAMNYGVPTVSLRFFTVFGPRQRPDMALHRLIEACCEGRPFPLYGSGEQIRDFTYVHDVVRAVRAAADAPIEAGTVLNVAGGSSVTMLEVIELVGELVGRAVVVDRQPPQAGDVERTGGSTERVAQLLGWRPSVSFAEGVAAQVDWHSARSLVV